MPIVHLALGSNLGDRLSNLRRAVEGFTPSISILAESPVYETPPWGLTEQPAFLNMVLRGETSLPPMKLLKNLKRLEVKLGRTPAVRWGPRLIDMDILFYDDLVLKTPTLEIPHPHLQERAFVLVPLADLSPDLVHPILQKTIRELLAKVDTTGVVRYE